MESFPLPKCTAHQRQTSDFIVLDHEIRRACLLCPIEGNNSVSHQAFQSIILSSISELLQSEAKAFNRHNELTSILEKVKGEYSKDDN